GLLCVGKKCGELRVLSLDKSLVIEKDGEWLRELAERTKNCGKTLVKMRIGECHLKYVADIFRYGVKLEDFSSDPYIDEGEEVPDVKFPPTMCSVAFLHGNQRDITVIQSFAHQLTKFDLRFSTFNADDHCVIIHLCVNLEVLYTKDTIGDLGLQFVGHVCKKLRTITVEKSGQVGLVSDVGLMALAKGCFELQSLHITIKDIRNTVLECIGANLKKLNDLGMVLHNKENVSDLPLDKGIRALLNGCIKLEKLRLVELSKGCPKLQKLEMSGCDFSQQALVTFVLNVTSLRYLWVEEYHAFKSGHDLFGMVRPFWKMELIKSKEFDYGPEGPTQQKPPSLLAYYSLAEQRNDFPKSVIPLYPFVEFD
ncbi:coronatine-insensitive protein 1-like protein, partial [Tanacetum coccineum]